MQEFSEIFEVLLDLVRLHGTLSSVYVKHPWLNRAQFETNFRFGIFERLDLYIFRFFKSRISFFSLQSCCCCLISFEPLMRELWHDLCVIVKDALEFSICHVEPSSNLENWFSFFLYLLVPNFGSQGLEGL